MLIVNATLAPATTKTCMIELHTVTITFRVSCFLVTCFLYLASVLPSSALLFVVTWFQFLLTSAVSSMVSVLLHDPCHSSHHTPHSLHGSASFLHTHSLWFSSCSSSCVPSFLCVCSHSCRVLTHNNTLGNFLQNREGGGPSVGTPSSFCLHHLLVGWRSWSCDVIRMLDS